MRSFGRWWTRADFVHTVLLLGCCIVVSTVAKQASRTLLQDDAMQMAAAEVRTSQLGSSMPDARLQHTPVPRQSMEGDIGKDMSFDGGLFGKVRCTSCTILLLDAYTTAHSSANR